MIKKKTLHVKQGDIVQVISGKQKGEIGTIKKIMTKTSQVIIENLNIKTKHVRPAQKEDSGKIITFEAPIHSSNVMLYSTKHKIRSRYRILANENAQKQRQLKRTKEIIK